MALSFAAASLCALGASSTRAAAGPQPLLAPDAVDFGAVQVGSVSSIVDVTLSNNGGGPLAFWRFGIASSSANASDFWVAPGGTCSVATPLAAGESCTVRVRFNPTAPGTRSGLLSFWVNTAAGRINAVLTGSAAAAPQPALDPGTVDFGTVQVGSVSDIVDVTLANRGGGPLSFWRFGIASSSANPSDFWVAPGGTCSVATPLAAGESCTVRVRFNPTATGNRAGLLSFWVNTTAGRINAGLTGSATPEPQPVLTPDDVDFGTVEAGSASDIVEVTLANSGGSPLSFWRFGIASSSVNPSDFWIAPGGTCSTARPLAAGESCTVRVRFKPNGIGTRAGLLSFWVNTPTGRIDARLVGLVDDPCADGCL